MLCILRVRKFHFSCWSKYLSARVGLQSFVIVCGMNRTTWNVWYGIFYVISYVSAGEPLHSRHHWEPT